MVSGALVVNLADFQLWAFLYNRRLGVAASGDEGKEESDSCLGISCHFKVRFVVHFSVFAKGA
jgi:hypothetical protein